MKTISQLENDVAELRGRLRTAEGLLRQALLDASPVKVGDVVVSKDGTETLVRFVKPCSYAQSGVDLRGSPKKKDGTFGIADRHVYGEWKVKPAN